jgi:prepilin-type N-terminal cleavage/methylation domain-containing protein
MPAAARGMSLIELLVAMALGVLLMALLNSVLNSVQTGWGRTTAITTASTDELAAAQFLFAAVESALPPDPLDQSTWFHGAAERIEFLSTAPAADAARGPIKILLYSVPRKGMQRALVVEVRAHPAPADSPQPSSARVLIDGLKSVSFVFSDASDQRSKELVTWSDPRTLPQEIGINIVFASGRARALNLAISPRRTISGRCVFDLLGLSCRT